MTRRVQPRLFGGCVTTYPDGRARVQMRLDWREAERQLEADALREFMERLRADALLELDDYTPEEG